MEVEKAALNPAHEHDLAQNLPIGRAMNAPCREPSQKNKYNEYIFQDIGFEGKGRRRTVKR